MTCVAACIPLPLLARIGTGAITGGAIGTLGGYPGLRNGAVLGAVGGVIGSFAGALLRRGGRSTGLPDLVFALIEDAASIASSAAVIAAE